MKLFSRKVAFSSVSLGALCVLASSGMFSNACTVTAPSIDIDGGGLGSDSGTSGEAGAQPTLPFQPSNVLLSGHDLSTLVDVDVTNDCDVSSDTSVGQGLCDGAAVDWIATQSDGTTKAHVFVVKSLKVEQNASIKISGSFAAIIISIGDISLLGPVKAAASGSSAGPGGYSGGSLFTQGAGPGGGPTGVKDGMGPSPGTGAIAGISGGGATFCGLGGSGTQENDPAGPLTISPGTPSAAYGTPDLRPLLAGSAGGNGGLSSAGGGGGAVQFVAGGAFTVGSLASITVGGGGGSDSGETFAGQQASGGGSGGALLIEASTATISGILAANGGGGGGKDTDGQDATPDGNAASGGTSNGAPQGGTGGAGATTAGGVGTVNASNAAGAGGGGVGRIRINTLSGAATITGTVSPAASTTCTAQGTVRQTGAGI